MCVSEKTIYFCGCAERSPILELCQDIELGGNCNRVCDRVIERPGNCPFFPNCHSKILRQLKKSEADTLPPWEPVIRKTRRKHARSRTGAHPPHRAEERPHPVEDHAHAPSPPKPHVLLEHSQPPMDQPPSENDSIHEASGSEHSTRESSPTSVRPSRRSSIPEDEKDIRQGWVEIDDLTGEIKQILDDMSRC